MTTPFYILVWVTGLTGLWLLWDRGIRTLFLDRFREQVFTCRFKLFQLGIEGKIALDSDLYRQLETLLCGLLRFGHRMTFLTFVLSRQEQERASRDKTHVNVSQQIALKIARLPVDVQAEISQVLVGVQHAILSYLAFTSVFFLTASAVLNVAKSFGVYRPDEAAKLSNVVAQEAYDAEQTRGLPLSAAAA